MQWSRLCIIVSEVVDQSSFEAMKSDSRSNMRWNATHRKADEQPFMRKGVVGMRDQSDRCYCYVVDAVFMTVAGVAVVAVMQFYIMQRFSH